LTKLLTAAEAEFIISTTADSMKVNNTCTAMVAIPKKNIQIMHFK
jgi:hypothetical protein